MRNNKPRPISSLCGSRDAQLSAAPFHVLVVSSRNGRFEAEGAKVRDQIFPFDRTNGRHLGDFADLETIAVDFQDRRVIGNANQ